MASGCGTGQLGSGGITDPAGRPKHAGSPAVLSVSTRKHGAPRPPRPRDSEPRRPRSPLSRDSASLPPAFAAPPGLGLPAARDRPSEDPPAVLRPTGWEALAPAPHPASAARSPPPLRKNSAHGPPPPPPLSQVHFRYRPRPPRKRSRRGRGLELRVGRSPPPRSMLPGNRERA
ncbi:formin-like protein 5 [Suricata suricatta]|uniref:formin-like protein 5 n=1 Tax=Suricata suricatta TaxID=37032 RepID=UPI00115546C1|nr:formin-like protein 5 [Suricata suricatta]